MSDLSPIIRVGWRPAAVRNHVVEFDEFLRDRLLGWEYTDKSSGADQGSLTMDNNDLGLFDHEAFLPNTRIVVQWGYAHNMHAAREIAVEKIKGFRKITVSGAVSEARGLFGIQRTRTFEERTEFEVAELIARELGFTQARQRSIEAGDVVVPRRGITQSGETDLAFLQRLSGRVGVTFYITGGVFNFHERRLSESPTLTFTFWDDEQGTIIGEPEIEQSVQGRPGSVRRTGHSPRERRSVQGQASNREDTGRPVLGEELPTSDPTGLDWASIANDIGADPLPQSTLPQQVDAQSDSSPSNAESDEEARSQARQSFRRAERMSVKMSMTVVGEPSASADSPIRVLGMGQRFSGNWYIEEATHTVSPGTYTTKMKLSRNALSRSRGTGRSRRRTNNQATTNVPAGADLPFSSEFGTWDSQGEYNLDGPPDFDVATVTDTDTDGNERVRYQARGGDLPQTTRPDPWEEDW